MEFATEVSPIFNLFFFLHDSSDSYSTTRRIPWGVTFGTDKKLVAKLYGFETMDGAATGVKLVATWANTDNTAT